MPHFYVGAGDLNSGVHAYKQELLPSESPSYSLSFIHLFALPQANLFPPFSQKIRSPIIVGRLESPQPGGDEIPR